MQKPRIYNSELLLQNLIDKSDTAQVIKYIRSLNKYIDFLERNVDLEDLDITTTNESEEDEE